MIYRNYDASIARWFGCVERGGHKFNASGTCMQCGAPKRGPEVQMRGGGLPRKKH